MKTYEEFLLLLDDPDVVVPNIRHTEGLRLEASAEENPCDACEYAEYNKLCTKGDHCAALKFHTLAKMPSMVHDFFSKEDE